MIPGIGFRWRARRADGNVDTGSVTMADAAGPFAAACVGLRPGRARRALPAAVVCLTAAALGCATTGGGAGPARIPHADLLTAASLGVPEKPSAAVDVERDVLGVSPEMQAFLDKHVDVKGSDELKLRQLVGAIIDSETFGLTYDNITRTAAETFHARLGNCLSFSNMFVAMARAVGLAAQFQEVDVPPDWTLDKDTYVLNQHVNVRLELKPSGVRVVDFNIADFKTSYEMRTIPDSRALAHYYNNVGVERMQAGDMAGALACFRKAIVDNDGLFSPAWTNLGTLYVRTGHPDRAEAAFYQALDVDDGDLVAMSDLARLYDRLGDRKRAAAFRKRVEHHRWVNPYYRYDLARLAYQAHNYDAAISYLKYAVRKRPNEDQFCFLLGLSYHGKGNERAAKRWMARAEEVAKSDALRRKYSSKIDTLLRGGGSNR